MTPCGGGWEGGNGHSAPDDLFLNCPALHIETVRTIDLSTHHIHERQD